MMIVSRFLMFAGWIGLGIASRMLPHPPNFTALNALALFGSFYFGGRLAALSAVVLTLFLTDLFFGPHSTAMFVYFSFGLTVLWGDKLRSAVQWKSLAYALPFISLGMSLQFFLISNFGVWLTTSLYPMSLSGLGLCYVAALPFLLNQMLGDFVYAGLIFSICSPKIVAKVLCPLHFVKTFSAEAQRREERGS